MNNFKVGNKVERIKPQTVTNITLGGYLEIDNESVYVHCSDGFKLSPPKIIYSNPPLSHFELRIEHAKGADIEFRSNSDRWLYVSIPSWLEDHDYRVKQIKSEAEKRIDILQKMIDDYGQHIINCRCELSSLKPKINY